MDYIELPTKPGAPLAYRFVQKPSNWLIVFINGLGLPSSSWAAAIAHFEALNTDIKPSILTYDRFGQGETMSRDPADSEPGREEGYGHDIRDSCEDLYNLISIIENRKLARNDTNLILVAASIGAHIARLYAAAYPEQVKGILILDSNLGHLEYSDLWPDPHAPDFDQDAFVADDCTPEQYIRATSLLSKMFASDAKNPEGLDRRRIKHLLPSAHEPTLVTQNCAPYILVVGHDPITFADDGFKKLGVPRSLNNQFINPRWADYNADLLNLTDTAHQLGCVIAPGSSHFIQKDNPIFVAEKMQELLIACLSTD